MLLLRWRLLLGMDKMLLYGASGHAKVICSCLESQSITIEDIFDDNEDLKYLNNYPVIGKYNATLHLSIPLIISIGNNQIRKKVSNFIKHSFGILRHKSCIIDCNVEIGEGSVFIHGSIVQRDTTIGKHCIINTAATIDHDCVLEDFVHISPNATLCGNVYVGEGTQVGANSVIKQGVKIGKWVTIGAGSVVLNNVADFSVVVGNPGRIIKSKNG
jgi:sugar O-acyltransferase (sialic acid O-acetyltransferase NeuD family)